MSGDPNKKQNEGTGSGEQKVCQQSEQQHNPQKRPSQGGSESGQDRKEQEQGDQRRAS